MNDSMGNGSGKKDNTSIKRILQILVVSVFMIFIVFYPAGTLLWPEAWILIVLYASSVFGALLWLRKHDPALLKERSERQGEGKGWDKILISFYNLFLFIMLALCGLDAVRFKWSDIPVGVEMIGFLLFVPAGIIMFLAAKENTYLSSIVRIQNDRQQRVVKTGAYSIVRHPMYAGMILLFMGIPIALGSLYGLIPAGAVIIILIIRTILEDRTLKTELEGYADYSSEVKYRLIPGVW
ncbi:MAG: isoprenylcysteine carboxylmethyltransferase family protein [Spirochaetales bacterium]|nr:isoprenylcysteine carboxylmethyltransferase family protein [Spirochaetales bacterium]